MEKEKEAKKESDTRVKQERTDKVCVKICSSVDMCFPLPRDLWRFKTD